MLHIVSIPYSPDKKPEWFFTGDLDKGATESISDAVSGDLFREGNASIVIRLQNGGGVLKLIKARSFHEYIRFLWRASRAHKEIRGNRILSSIGVCVPEVKAYGYSPLPLSAARFIGFILMQDLSLSGMMDSRKAMQQNILEGESRQHFMKSLIKDITLMYEHALVFNDLKLPNIFTNKDGDLVWIDTGVSHYNNINRYKLAEKHDLSIQRFLRRHETLLKPEEKVMMQSLFSELMHGGK